MTSILTILTSTTQTLDGEPTGFWLEELAAPFYAWHDAGVEVALCAMAGGKAQWDPKSYQEEGENPAVCERFVQDKTAVAALENLPALEAMEAARYDGIFIPGGVGCVFDMAEHPVLSRVLSAAYTSEQVIASVCHGPAALIGPTTPDGSPLVAGKKVNCFTRSEDEAAGLGEVVPFFIEDRLKELGAKFVHGPDWAPFVVEDGLLITGQNPASSSQMAKKVLEILNKGEN